MLAGGGQPAGRSERFSCRLPGPSFEDRDMTPRRRAFTLVELLVVIAILGMLAAILLPSVQTAREAGRRVQCQNNLRQLALAITTYESLWGAFPSAGIVDPPSNSGPLGGVRMDSGRMFSWVVLILPQLEQQNLYDRFDLTKNVKEQPLEPQAEFLPVMLCASDAARNRYFRHDTWSGGKRFAKGNYAAYVSPAHTEQSNIFPGALVTHHAQRAGHFRDGLSNTFMLSEVRTRAHEGDPRGAWALPWNGSTTLAFDMHHDFTANGGKYVPFVPWKSDFIIQQVQLPNSTRSSNVDVLYTCADSAGAQLEGMPCGEYASLYYMSGAPRSMHPGGVFVAFADGHLGWINDEIDPLAMAYLISINDHQPVSPAEHVR
jgi:prepilin-type N-terminal cleavage/methylation domain-containing protein